MTTTRAARADEAVASALRGLIARDGEAAAVARVGMARATVARLCAGLPVQPTTLIVAAQRLGVPLTGMPAGVDLREENGHAPG